MRNASLDVAVKRLTLAVVTFLSTLVPRASLAAGVTVITHGLNGNVEGWVTGMAERIPSYPGFPGTNSTFYKLYFVPNGSGYNLAWSRLAGSPPSQTDSGEIIVAFDWSQLADGNSYSTYQVAPVLEEALLSTNFIPELDGHALGELPIHLIGHSRGGSLMCQTSFLLGTNGVWVDQLTTLDPHPLNNDGFTLDSLLYSVTDAPCATYQNVLFHDNYWEDLNSVVRGEPVAGAYVRQLYNLSGGYQNTGDLFYPHSNVHLWYHGTLDLDTPASDTEASIGGVERTNWWASYEQEGTNAGFYYTLIGGGDRMSADRPLGLPGDPAIRDGYNQWWDFGAGNSANRTPLPSNSGTWPNLIQFRVVGTNIVTEGRTIATTFYYQYGGASNSVTAQFYFDRDLNPYDTNSTSIAQISLPNTGVNDVFQNSLNLPTTNVPPGVYAIYGKISDGVRTRYLYAPEQVQIASSREPPALEISKPNGSQFVITVNGLSGQRIVLQTSTDLQHWQPVATNTLASDSWALTNNAPPDSWQFYRAVLPP